MLESRLHHALLAGILADGFAPDAAELAARLSVPLDEVTAGLQRLADGHGAVLHPGTSSVWVVHPFSLSPAQVWVAAGARGHWAACLWCAFGAAALIGGDCELHARLGGAAAPITLRIRSGRLEGPDVVVHFPLPPRQAWDNVIHWCATVQPFLAATDVDTWCARHRLARGAIVPLATVRALGERWYGGHLAPDWRKHTAREAEAIFNAVGLVGDFWGVPGSDERF